MKHFTFVSPRQRLTENPFPKYGVNDVEGQHQDGDGQVGHGQRYDEEVLHDPERLVREHAEDHQDVADDGEQDEERQRADRQGGLPFRDGRLAEDGAEIAERFNGTGGTVLPSHYFIAVGRLGW